MSQQKRLQVKLTGQVQGVGCRPFVYNLAHKLELTGFVQNDTQGVLIEVQGANTDLETFLHVLQSGPDRPVLFHLDSLATFELPVCENESEFCIQTSGTADSPTSRLCPDIAVCADCLAEMNAPADFRYRYPFINCTQCGPRYSIIKTIPYDRPNTTMAEFAMCPRCRSQYEDAADRRFHAQPVACPVCGPRVTLWDNKGAQIETDSDGAVSRTAQLLLEGSIIAIKGIGGFHLAVNALDEQAVGLLRKRKRREAKPFAMMAGGLDIIERYAVVHFAEKTLLTSPSAPIVLLPKKHPNQIAPAVAEGTSSFGFMLPYAPLYYLLFAEPGIEVLVMTSANLSDEPLICDNDAALEQLGNIADYFLMHNRPVYRQVDDSVTHIVDGKPALLRRSRGYVPEPILNHTPAAKEILAAGADLKNTFCFVKGSHYLLSEHIGDLENPAVYRHYIRSIDHLAGLFEIKPEVIIHDLHPTYFSTQFAQNYAKQAGIPAMSIQHHWAHAAAVMAEYNLQGDVIALMADGTGYGTDGAIWGCECLVCSLTQMQRFGHLDYYPLAGGDAASVEAIRPILGLSKTAGITVPEDILARIEPDMQKIRIISRQIENEFATVPTSSLGRVFDAVAALVNRGTHNHFEAQLPIALEAIAEPKETGYYPIQLRQTSDGKVVWSIGSVLDGLLDDIRKGHDASVMSARFHRSTGRALLEFAVLARQQTGLNQIALSGGVFCNRYLANYLIEILQNSGFQVFFSRRVPANDGCIALGQAAIANEKLKLRK
ncbi:MAG TPA: carbamoyltransferase HypF [Anaerohalosphaeraceae bacterium]|nr:carbamoyltransferase HypF [Anaerohalosphaeraceae bacterium]